jgi:hypothetical protein
VEFFNATPNIIAAGANNDIPVNSLSKTPVTTAEQTVSGTAASNTVTFAAWLYNTALGRTSIPAGVWEFTTFCAVNSTAGGRVTTLTRQLYAVNPAASGTVTVTGTGTSRTATASAGTPFATANIDASATNTTASFLQTPLGLYQITARTSDTVVTILVPSGYSNETAVAYSTWKKLFGSTTPAITATGTNYTAVDFQTSQSAFTISTTTKLGAVSFVTSNNTTTLTLSYNGTARNTHFATPLTTLHNELSGLNGGAADEMYHLTSAEYTGTGSGNFVRETSPTLTTPTIGVATATSVNKVAITAPATSATLTIPNGVTLTGPASSGTTATLANAETLTNKRITRRVVTVTQSATPTINTDNTDVASITGLAQAITSMTTNLSGTPAAGEALVVEITDNGTARAITWGASFEASGNVALPTTTVISTKLSVGFFWNSATSKWRCMAVA